MGFINQSTSLAGTTGISPFYVVKSLFLVVESQLFVITSLGVTPLQRWYWSKSPWSYLPAGVWVPSRAPFDGPGEGRVLTRSDVGVQWMGVQRLNHQNSWVMGYLVEYYEHFMGEQPSQPDFCPSWVTWKCWESGENPMLSTGKSGFPLFLGIIPNFYTHV